MPRHKSDCAPVAQWITRPPSISGSLAEDRGFDPHQVYHCLDSSVVEHPLCIIHNSGRSWVQSPVEAFALLGLQSSHSSVGRARCLYCHDILDATPKSWVQSPVGANFFFDVIHLKESLYVLLL